MFIMIIVTIAAIAVIMLFLFAMEGNSIRIFNFTKWKTKVSPVSYPRSSQSVTESVNIGIIEMSFFMIFVMIVIAFFLVYYRPNWNVIAIKVHFSNCIRKVCTIDIAFVRKTSGASCIDWLSFQTNIKVISFKVFTCYGFINNIDDSSHSSVWI